MKIPLLKCGIVGTGAFAALHAQAITSVPGVSLAAVCDIDQTRAKQFSEKWGGKACDSLNVLSTENEVDIITIATPDETHAPIIVDILKANNAPRLIIVEKPLCVSREELQSIEANLQTTETRLVVDHTRRFNKGFARVRDLIASGDLGDEILSVRFRYYAGWFHIGVHAVDTLRMLIGDLRCINATVQGVDRYEADPLLDVTLQSEKYPNAPIRLEGIPEDNYKICEADIFLPCGRIRIDWEDIFISRAKDDDANAPVLRFDEHFSVEPVEKSLEHLYEQSSALLEGGHDEILTIAGFETAKRTMAILFDAKQVAE